MYRKHSPPRLFIPCSSLLSRGRTLALFLRSRGVGLLYSAIQDSAILKRPDSYRGATNRYRAFDNWACTGAVSMFLDPWVPPPRIRPCLTKTEEPPSKSCSRSHALKAYLTLPCPRRREASTCPDDLRILISLFYTSSCGQHSTIFNIPGIRFAPMRWPADLSGARLHS